MGIPNRALVQYNSFNSRGWLTEIEDLSSTQVIFGDIRDPQQMISFVEGATCVIHLAALIAIPFSYQAPSSYVETNVQGTLNLLNASRQASVDRFVHTSTSEVYGTAQYVPIDESHPLQPQSPYSASKIAADALVQSFWHSFDFPAVTIRPFNTFGPRQSFRAVIPTLLAQGLSGSSKIKLGNLSPTRDFTFVSDTVQGILAGSSQANIEGETFNLGTGFEFSIADIARVSGELLGKDLDSLIETDLERFRPPSSEVDRLLSNNEKAMRVLGWKPDLVGEEGLRRGLEKTIEWLRPRLASGLADVEKYVI